MTPVKPAAKSRGQAAYFKVHLAASLLHLWFKCGTFKDTCTGAKPNAVWKEDGRLKVSRLAVQRGAATPRSRWASLGSSVIRASPSLLTALFMPLFRSVHGWNLERVRLGKGSETGIKIHIRKRDLLVLSWGQWQVLRFTSVTLLSVSSHF